MRYVRRSFGLVVYAVAVSASVAAGQDAGSLGEDVRRREIAFAQTMVDRDHDAFLSFLSAEAVFFQGDVPIRGADAIARAWAPFFAEPQPPFSWSPDVVEVLDSGGLAFSSGPVLNASGEPAGRFNSVWRLEPDGEWRVIFDKGS